jgi:TP901 family phage tail tape measure protein
MVSTGEISADLVLHDKTSQGLAAAATSMKAVEGALAKSGTAAGTAYSNALATSIKNSTASIQASLSGVLGNAGALALKTGWAGAAVTGGASAALSATGIESGKYFANFDDMMRKVSAVTSATDAQFKQLTATAKELGATTSFTAQESAQAMIYLGQAGFDANQIIAAMPATLSLARGSMTDLATTADIMSNIMNSFQVPAENTAYAADVLAMAANRTNTNVTQLGQAMKFVAPLAHQMGWSLEETAAAAGLLSNAGIKADMAGTVLRNSIARLISPTQSAVDILGKYGLTMDMVNPKVHNLASILETLQSAGMSSGDVMEVFGMRAGPGMMALLNQGTTALREMEAELNNSQGYAQSAAAAMDEGFGGALREAGNALEAMQLTLGEAVATVATPLLFAFSAVGKALAQLPQPIWVAVAAMGALAAAGLGILSVISVFGLMLPGLVTGLTALGIVEAGATLTTAGLAAAIWAALAPVAAVVVAVGLVVGALYLLEKQTGLVSSTWGLLKDIFIIVADGIMKAARILRDFVVGALQEVKEAISDMLPAGVVEGITSSISKITGQFSDMRNGIHESAVEIEKDGGGITDMFNGWGEFDPSDTVSGISMVDVMINQTGTDALTATESVESLMNVDSGSTGSGIAEINSGLQETLQYGPEVFDILYETGNVSMDQLNAGLFITEATERAVAETGSEMFYIISDAGNVRMDGTNSQLVAINDNGSMSALTINELKGYLEGTSNVSQGGTIQQLALVDQQGKVVNLTTQQVIQLLQNAGNQPMTGTIAGWNNVRGTIQGAIGDAYKFIEVNNEVANSISKIGAAYKTTAEQVGNVSALAGKWNTRETPGTVKSSGGSGTGEGNVKIKDPRGLYSSTTNNVKINTINNNGTSTSKTNVKKAGV